MNDAPIYFLRVKLSASLLFIRWCSSQYHYV